MEEVERQFRPEFLNRLDETITFNPLQKDDLYRIIKIEIEKVEARMAEQNITFNLSDAACDFLIEKGFNPQYGARPLRRTIERFIEDPLAEELLRSTLEPGSFLEMEVAEDGESLKFFGINNKVTDIEEENSTSSSTTEE